MMSSAINELERVKESKSDALHPYSTGNPREPVDRAYGALA
jgi:hypothetical protein